MYVSLIQCHKASVRRALFMLTLVQVGVLSEFAPFHTIYFNLYGVSRIKVQVSTFIS